MRGRTALGFGLAGIAAGVAATRRWGPHLRAVAAVPRELRSPVLFRVIEVRSNARLRLNRMLPKRPAPVAPGVRMEQRAVPSRAGHPGTQVHVYDTRTRSRPTGALLWIHGGGYVGGDPIGDHTLCSEYARDLGIVVVSATYRLAPDHPFPAGLEDCYAALRWMHENADELGVDRDRIAIGGESAGGGLAAALAQLAYDRGEVAVCFQLLVYPMLDDRTALDRRRPRTLVWSPAANVFGWTSYLGHPPRLVEDRPYAVPSRREDLRGLPPAWIGVGDIDLFYEEDVAYAERLQAAGVPCQLEIVPGFYHGAFKRAPDHSMIANGFRDSAMRALEGAIGTRAEPVEAPD